MNYCVTTRVWCGTYLCRQYSVFFQAEKALVDVGEIVVGGYRSVELPLVNQSPCSVSFCLSGKETVLDKDVAIDSRLLPNGIFCCNFLNNCTVQLHFFLNISSCINIPKCTLPYLSCWWCNDENYQAHFENNIQVHLKFNDSVYLVP